MLYEVITFSAQREAQQGSTIGGKIKKFAVRGRLDQIESGQGDKAYCEE